MENLTAKIIELGAMYSTKIIGAIAILVLGRIAVGIFTKVIKRLMEKGKTDKTLTKFAVSFIKITLMTFIVIAALGNLGIQTSSFVAIIAAAGLVIGFALQSSLSNFASGVMLIIFRPFKRGDYIKAAGTSGTVESIQIFNTTLKTPDNVKVIVPNSKITGDNITNYSAEKQRRVDLVFGIGYDDNIRMAKETLEQILSEDDRILTDPAPVVAVSELADSSVNFVVRPWVKSADYWSVYYDLNEKVKLTFDEKNISIPFPQSDVHLHKVTSV